MLFRLLITFFLFLLFSCRPFVKIFEDIEEAMYFKSSNIIESEFGDSLKVMTWNIRFGGGRIPYVGDSCGDRSLMTEDETTGYLDKIISYIETSQPDILLFQEISNDTNDPPYYTQVRYFGGNSLTLYYF